MDLTRLVLIGGIGWSTVVHGYVWVGRAKLSTHPQQRILSHLSFSYAGGLGINRRSFTYRIGGENTFSDEVLLELSVDIVKHDDGEYSVTRIPLFFRHEKLPTGGSYTPNEDESFATLAWYDDHLGKVTISITKETGNTYRDEVIVIEGTITPPDGQQAITFSDKLHYPY